MIYIKAYLIIALVIFCFFVGLFVFSKEKSREDVWMTLGISIFWPILIFIFIFSWINDRHEQKKNAENKRELLAIFEKNKSISNNFVQNNCLGLNAIDCANIELAYNSVFRHRINTLKIETYKIEYINDLIVALEKSMESNGSLLQMLQDNGVNRKKSRIAFRESLGEGSHISYVEPNTRIVVTATFEKSLIKIRNLRDFEFLCQAILSANDYLGKNWDPLKILPESFELNGLLLSIKFADDLILILVTVSDPNQIYTDAYLLSIATKE